MRGYTGTNGVMVDEANGRMCVHMRAAKGTCDDKGAQRLLRAN